MTHRTGRITKSDRRDLRYTMIQAAYAAVEKHPHWKAQFERLEPRLGRSNSVVAIARKLLVAVWHVLAEGCADKHADPEKVGSALFRFAYRVGVDNLPDGVSATLFTGDQLDQLEIGQDLTQIRHGTRSPKLPKSKLVRDGSAMETLAAAE